LFKKALLIEVAA